MFALKFEVRTNSVLVD